MITIVFPVIVILGLQTNITNCAFLFTLAGVRQMRTITNFYLANLAFADLLYIIATAVNIFYRYTWSAPFSLGEPWTSKMGCAAIVLATYMSHDASIGLVTLVSLERFLAICFPLKHRMINTNSRTVKMVLATWLIALVFTALKMPSYTKHASYCFLWPEKWQQHFPTVVYFCTAVKRQFYDITAICEFAPFIIALILNTIVYALIIRRLSQRVVSDKGNDKTGLTSEAQRTRNVVARMLVINGIAFFVCLAPWQFINMYDFVLSHCVDCRALDESHVYILRWMGRCFNVLNSAMNPIIYCATNARYRHAFITAFSCTSKKRNVSKVSMPAIVAAKTNVATTRM